MILLDTNVPIYASEPGSPFCDWSRRTVSKAVAGGGAAINAVILAELCVGATDPSSVADRIRSWGVAILDVPSAVSEQCARAYAAYRERRRAESGKSSSAVPLPDFFIGAHCEVMGWKLATVDIGRFKTYFPAVKLLTPDQPS